eukprot:TRINITY_DN1511_c0_g1_i4.p1 TRINITY_DN1511_c0_g1~~TRINITY_DN1511_c0_g1_i4.p1  ORF type:complete len:273 (+),score=115.57 TRINITY_DN1511_c0_g1_i4:79-897(+)
MAAYKYETLEVEDVGDNVLHVRINRPEKRNAMNAAFWRESVECFTQIAQDANVRAVVLSGNGKIFTAGLDLSGLNLDNSVKDTGRRALRLQKTIRDMQESFTVIERCPQPVIAACHGACVGGGIDMITACDIRFASPECWFCIKEVDIGLAADVGTLQRLPKIVGNEGVVKELAYTARRFEADEAQRLGLVTRVYTKDTLIPESIKMAKLIASKSPIAVTGTKVALNYARDHTVEESLRHITLWNSAALQSQDVIKAAQASMAKKQAVFAKL